MKKLSFQIRQKLVDLSGVCFWYWGTFHDFLDRCGVNGSILDRYPRELFNKYQVMKNVLNDLEESDQIEVINNIISNFFQLSNAVDRDNLDEQKAKKILQEFKELVGNDPIEKVVKKRQIEENRKKAKKKNEEQKLRAKKLDELKEKFLTLLQDKSDPQKRGFDFEKLFFEILDLEQFEYSKPFKNVNEQIDGHFKYEKFDYLVELKWKKNVAKQEDLSIFDGKIKSKAQSTRGFFLAVNGFDQNMIYKFSIDSPRIILMDGQDLMGILEGRITFFDCLKAKIDALVKRGEIFFKVL